MSSVRIGVLALQGSFREHLALLQRVPGVECVEVRTKEELQGCAGLIIPGGESTTQALVAERWGLIPELQSFANGGRPIWGTCAGMIFLAERAEGGREQEVDVDLQLSYAPVHLLYAGQKKGGQALLGGLDITVSRNFFGAQINSFETMLPAPTELQALGE
jgi:5'-phosphate synthase pdxT subunit